MSLSDSGYIAKTIVKSSVVIQTKYITNIPVHTVEFFHNSRLIRRIQQKDWSQINCLTVSLSNHYTRMFSVLVWDCKWILVHAWMILSNLSNSSNWMKISLFWQKLDCYLNSGQILSELVFVVFLVCPFIVVTGLDTRILHWRNKERIFKLRYTQICQYISVKIW